jgi:hypothetical protein
MNMPKRAPVQRPTVPETPTTRKRSIVPGEARRDPSQPPPEAPAPSDDQDLRPTVRIPRTAG